MNSRERFLSALKGEKVDRTPLAHVSALTTVELQELTGCFMPEVHMNPEKLAKLCFANHQILGFDAVTFIINYFNEPAALGCEMRWGGKRELPMYTSHPWVKEEDAFIPEDLLDRQPISTYLESLKIAKRDYGEEVAVLGKIMGPFSMVQVMHGVEKTMIDMLENPEKIKYFLNIATDILIKCANAQFEAGIDALAIGEGGAGGDMLSPQMHKEFLLDIHKRMIKEIHGPTIMHICGNILPRLQFIAESGTTCFNFDWAIKPEVMKKLSGGKFKIMGNINTTDLLRAKPEEIERQVIENLKAGVDIISPGCAISPECPNKNFQIMVQTIKRYYEEKY
ncbi:MtaA/CmuA family methyltransferase [Candidatus Calescamantes bacterium]|nr:MtaA/CmuA family methyltransferase [Candidatus Calescamantes bacterium]